MRRKKYKILLVEDAKIAQAMAIITLNELHCDVNIASNGIEAIEQIKKTIYDIVFMDLGLPDMDGFSTTEKIRKHEKTTNLKRTPIIALTSHEGEHIEITCHDHDMDDFLVKPLTEKKALSMLKKYVLRKKSN